MREGAGDGCNTKIPPMFIEGIFDRSELFANSLQLEDVLHRMIEKLRNQKSQ
jgi:hypothetical protein